MTPTSTNPTTCLVPVPHPKKCNTKKCDPSSNLHNKMGHTYSCRTFLSKISTSQTCTTTPSTHLTPTTLTTHSTPLTPNTRPPPLMGVTPNGSHFFMSHFFEQNFYYFLLFSTHLTPTPLTTHFTLKSATPKNVTPNGSHFFMSHFFEQNFYYSNRHVHPLHPPYPNPLNHPLHRLTPNTLTPTSLYIPFRSNYSIISIIVFHEHTD